MIEQEIKLVFDSIEAARRAVTIAGGRLVVYRRLLVDMLFDTEDDRLQHDHCTLRLRRDGDDAILTFKGPTHPGPVKSREEIETTVGNASVAEHLVRALGFRPGFRSEKYREEYALGAAHVAIDETPIGVFVEIEAEPAEIERAASQLDRGPDDYRIESYSTLYADWCRARGLTAKDMTFEIQN